MRAPDAEPAGAQSAAPGPRRPALHERLRADLGRRAGIGDWGFGIRCRAARPVRRRSPDHTHTLDRQLPRFSKSTIPNPQYPPHTITRKPTQATTDAPHNDTT